MSIRAPSDARQVLEAVWRMESAKIIAKLARMLRQVGRAEELAQDAFVTALEQWPRTGIPDNPGAWLMTTSKNRALDELRHRRLVDRHSGSLAFEAVAQGHAPATPEDSVEDDIGDDLLRLVFIASHPVLSREARAALTLRLLGGLSTEEIARAFLVTESTIGQRIVRAKRTLAEARIPFELPPAQERDSRLASVLEVIYLVFNEGYSATAGGDLMRPALCEEALRLGRILAALMPSESEVHGLVGLMEIQASRTPARVDESGDPILLLNQNRGRWDQLLIHRGLAALGQAERLGGALGPFALQGAIAACHARARTAPDTDWARIVALYDALSELAPSPVVALNRAVAVSMAFGANAGLELIDGLTGDAHLRDYYLLPSVRGDLLEKLGRAAEARREFERAASLAQNERVRNLLLVRAKACGESPS